MLQLIPPIRQRFLDENGDPLAGGKLYSYLAGTTTPVVTYVDSTGATPNTNPIVLDANGECDVWVHQANYKFKLADANDAEIWVRDNVSPGASGGGGGSSLLALPTDGAYGTHDVGDTSTAGPITGVDQGFVLEDAFDAVENVFQKLAPAKPANLSATPLAISGSYQSMLSGATSPTTVAVTTDNASPVIATQNAFADGAKGELTASIDGTSVGDIDPIVGGTTATDNLLQITSNVDPYAGQFGKQNFWFELLAQINASALSVGSHNAIMTHSISGAASLAFDVDDPVTPSIDASGRSLIGSGTGVYISGVPALTIGNILTAAFTVDNAVKSHYNSTRIAAASAPEAGSANLALPGTAPSNGASIAASIALSIITGQYNENVAVAATGYNSKGVSASASLTGHIRVDTLSFEVGRVISGAGQFPTKGVGGSTWGGLWDATASLATNKELQILGGAYQYPPAVNYSSNLPVAGPDYSSLSADTFNNCRWVTFQRSALSNATSFTFTINNEQNFGSSTLISGIYIYVLVDGATGWVDANAAYPGTGNPSSNGDAALDISNSTVTSRRVTFGANPQSGTVYIRIGIPSGSNKKFSGVS